MKFTYNDQETTGWEMLISLILSIPNSILGGVVLMKFWAWFVVPVFALPVLGLVQAIGISWTVFLLTHDYGSKRKESKPLEDQVNRAIAYGVTLLCGWILTFFL